jgi:hypothetical protein
MGIVGEVQIALEQRIDPLGNLSLDDGSFVMLAEGDEIAVNTKTNGATIIYVDRILPSGKRMGIIPGCVLVNTPNGARFLAIPPNTVGSTCSGTVK